MASRAQKIRLAVFVLSAAGVLLLFLFYVAGRSLLTPRQTYYVEFPDSIGGLRNGDKVTYLGIQAGRVENTSILPEDPTVIVVEISLERDRIPNAIREDTRARLNSVGITGLKYIGLVPGSPDSPVLPPGSRIASSPTFLSEMDERAQQLTDKMGVLLDNLTEMTDRENSAQLNSMLASGSEFTASANDLMNDNRRQIGESFRNLASMTKSLAGAAASLHATMDSVNALLTGGELRGALSDLRSTSRALRLQMDGPVPQLLANLSRMAGNIDTTFMRLDRTVMQGRRDFLDSMQDLQETMLNVRQATELIRENPSILIRGRADR